MLKRLPIPLVQSNAGNNSEQLFSSLCRSKRLTKHIYKGLNDIIQNMQTLFMNTKNSKTRETYRVRLDLTGKLNLKDPKKNMASANFKY